MSVCPALMMSGGFPCICNLKENKQTCGEQMLGQLQQQAAGKGGSPAARVNTGRGGWPWRPQMGATQGLLLQIKRGHVNRRREGRPGANGLNRRGRGLVSRGQWLLRIGPLRCAAAGDAGASRPGPGPGRGVPKRACLGPAGSRAEGPRHGSARLSAARQDPFPLGSAAQDAISISCCPSCCRLQPNLMLSANQSTCPLKKVCNWSLRHVWNSQMSIK